MLPIILLVTGCGDDAVFDPDGGTSPFDAAGRDAAIPGSDAAGTDAGMPTNAPALYASDRTHSPITPFVANRLRELAMVEPHSDDVFAKVGDSITVSTGFMHCFDGTVELGEHGALTPSLDHFRMGDAAGGSPFGRTSLAAGGGWQASMVIGAMPRVDQEIDAIDPAFAIVMFGTNDVGAGDPFGYSDSMMTLVDRLLARGVVPILSSIPPRDDNATADALVPLYNLVIRGIAQGRQVPFVDYRRELEALPMHGLSSDGVHPNQAPGGACVLDESGLDFGYNVRNLLGLEALDRARSAIDGVAPDSTAPVMSGTGTARDPFVIPSLPFTDLRNTMDSSSRAFSEYPGCMAMQNEAGPEYVYRFMLSAPTNVHLYVFDRGMVDVDLHLLDDPDPSSCIARGHLEVEQMLAPGEYYVTIDSFVMGSTELAGEYLLVITGG